MRVFVTGASGLIGRAVTRELLNTGHTVLGLARSDKAAEVISDLGAEVHRGSLYDLDSLKAGAAASDGVIHLAFDMDFTNVRKSCDTDQAAIRAMADALAGSNRPLIITSGTLLLPRDRVATEDDVYDPSTGPLAIRGESEELAKSLASNGVRSAVMRLAPTNHGDGDAMFMAEIIHIARAKGVSAYIGDGLNRWPAVHYLDTAVAFRLALEQGSAGATYHVVAEEGVRMKDIAEAIGKKLEVPVVSKSMEQAQEHFGFFAALVGANSPVSSKKTREALGWTPKQWTLLEDLEHGKYFE
ncbi:uncharacterized protein PV09_01282 [Verruconis gallopava]|uniref:NAD-dependent epimerase/dehydratase domain-containing protein n=1 Tax=Verruconis gallopava TaxID=253628 RepID=A0A0D1XZX5_9PEZI|nr:uncharacterized protein PV09_01282 [Verruconis gallopava]KIW08366.1 hypothetical protein PV09_01282 [Verruconis gallopava]